METLAYLHDVESYDQAEDKDLNLRGLKTVVTTGLLAAGVTVGAIATSADSASACGWRGCYRPVVWQRPCWRPVYYRPVVVRSWSPCHYCW